MDVISFLSFSEVWEGKAATIWGQGPWRILLCRVGGLVCTLSHTMKAEDLL